MTRPIVVILEGIDGGGKSMHAKCAHEYLLGRGRKAHLYRDPGGTTIGEQIRSLVKNTSVAMHQHTQFLLFCAARAELAWRLGEHLQAGDDIVLDRWWYSTFCYQGADGISEGAITRIAEEFASISFTTDHGITGKPAGLAAYHLHVTPATARTRFASPTRVNDAPKDRYESKPVGFLEKVYERYLELEQRGYLERVETEGWHPLHVWENLQERIENQINQYG